MDNGGTKNFFGDRAKTVALLIASGLLWSLGGVFIKTTDAHPFAISAIRSFTAALCLLAYLRGKPRFVFTRAQWLGALSYAATLTSFVTANKLTTSANAILLQYTSPIFVALLCWLIYRTPLFWYDFLSMGGVAAGFVFLLAGSIGYGSAAGNIVAVSSGFFFGAFMVALKSQKTGSRVETIILGNFAAVLIGLPFLFIYPIALEAVPPVVFLGAFQIALPYALFAKASERASALDLSIFPIVEPLFNPLWVFLATRELPAPMAFVGGVILLGVITFRSVVMIKLNQNNVNN